MKILEGLVIFSELENGDWFAWTDGVVYKKVPFFEKEGVGYNAICANGEAYYFQAKVRRVDGVPDFARRFLVLCPYENPADQNFKLRQVCGVIEAMGLECEILTKDTNSNLRLVRWHNDKAEEVEHSTLNISDIINRYIGGFICVSLGEMAGDKSIVKIMPLLISLGVNQQKFVSVDSSELVSMVNVSEIVYQAIN